MRLLGTNPYQLASLKCLKRHENCRHERQEFLTTIRLCNQHDDGDALGADVLLKRELLVDGQECVEAGTNHESQDLAIPLARPAKIAHMRDLVPR